MSQGLLYDTGQFLFPCILLDAASVHVCSTLIVWTLKKLELCFVKEIGKEWGHTHKWRTAGHPVNPFCLVQLFVFLLFVCNLCASRGMETWCSRKWLKGPCKTENFCGIDRGQLPLLLFLRGKNPVREWWLSSIAWHTIQWKFFRGAVSSVIIVFLR